MPADEARVLERLRKICLGFPHTSETSSWGHPNWRTPKRMFAAFDEYGGKNVIAFIAAEPILEALADNPHFKRAGHRGWALRDLDKIDWRELRALLTQAHTLATAPSKKPKAKTKKPNPKRKSATRRKATPR